MVEKMKKKMIVGSIFVVFMLMLLPSTTAVQLNTGLNRISKLPDFKDIQNMNMGELTDFIMKLTEGNLKIQDEIIRQVEEIEDEDILLEELADSNQSLIEKIWIGIFNYRLFRLYVSLWISVYHQSKITIMRTIHWAMKLLRWIEVGIILDIVDINPDGPQETPHISFDIDMENNTLTVSSVYPEDVMWGDIDQIGSGTCNPLPTGNVTVGDEITNCMGMIVLRYIPTNEVIGVFEF